MTTSYIPYTNSWNLSDAIISRLGLRNEGKNIGESFRNEARIFEIAEIGGVYILECDLNGNVSEHGEIFVFLHRNKKKRYLIISIEFMKDVSRANFLYLINSEIKRLNY